MLVSLEVSRFSEVVPIGMKISGKHVEGQALAAELRTLSKM
jgi:hypothetical protein